jgi:predicted Zn finger-like uncharacterized protein
MFTVCPKCTLTLALTTGDLRMGQGYVRCGRCANVFNALLTLSEEPVEDAAAAPARPQVDPASGEQLEAALNELLPETATPAALPSRRSAEASAPPAPHLTTEQSSDGGIENESSFAEGTGTFETIVLEGDAITQTEEYVPEASVDSEIAALTERLGKAAYELEAVPPPSDPGPMTLDTSRDNPTALSEYGASPYAAADFAPQPHIADRSLALWPWIVGSVVLLLLLAAQGIHHWRERIAASAFLGPALTRTYAALGLPLTPHWNLAAYDVRQQGAVSDPNDSQIIRVRLSVTNHAPQAQPLPLVRLTLLDRYGKRVARRELTPSEYWPSAQPPHTFLAHEERVDSEIAVHDPGAASASFELDVCLRSNEGALHCAGDATPTLSPAIGTGAP